MLVLQRDVLSIVIVHWSDTFGDDPEYTIRSYRRQHTVRGVYGNMDTWEGEITG